MELPDVKFHGNLTYNDWLMEWFGFHAGRDMLVFNRDAVKGSQKFYDRPSSILWFVRYCKKYNKPAYLSVNPRTEHNVVYGVERIFFDFDAHKPSEQDRVVCDTRRFVASLYPVKPLVVKSMRGYHVYLFFKQGVLKVGDNRLAKEFYQSCQQLLLNGNNYRTLDRNVLGDVKRLSRVPLSWHELGGWVTIVDENLEPTKVRSLDFYRTYGLDSEFVNRTVRLMILTREKREQQQRHATPPPQGTFKIRPCFEYALNSREMSHQQRLALVNEAFWAGLSEEEIINLFTNLRDYNREITAYQVGWLLDKLSKNPVKPYRCSTLASLGFCIKTQCPIWNRKHAT